MSVEVELLTDIEARVRIENAMRINYSDEQWEVVKGNGRPSSVISCAGSGKTTVLIARLLYQELVFGIKAYEMLVITFNKKASTEIEERYNKARKRMGLGNFTPSFNTFHAFFLRLLRTDTKYADTEVVDSYKYSFALTDLIKNSTGFETKLDTVKSILATRSYGINNKKDYLTYNEYGDVGRAIINKYEALLKENNEMDFDDMLLLLYRELFERGNKELLQVFKETYKLVLIDEFQDISGIQYDIIEELLNEIGMNSLTVIGDADQCIYSFRGSNPRYITQFSKVVPSAKTHFLSVNYRCPQAILSFVAPSIYRNRDRVEIALQSSEEEGIVDFVGVTEDDELLEAVEEDFRQGKSVAILVRNNHQKTIISDRLTRKGIAVDMGSSSYTVKNNQVFKKLSTLIKIVRESDNSGFIKNYWMFGVSKRHLPAIKARYRGSDELWVEDVLEYNMWEVSESRKSDIRHLLQEDRADELYKLAMGLHRGSFLSGANKGYYNMSLIEDYYRYIVEGISKGVDYHEFIAGIDANQRRIDKNLGNKNAVQLATMHTVKGLEYDTVVVYDPSDSEVFPDFRVDWLGASFSLGVTEKELKTRVLDYDDEALNALASEHSTRTRDVLTVADVRERIESERRLFYVACTRAKERLIIATDLERRSSLVMEALAHRGEVDIPVVPVKDFEERTVVGVEEEIELQRKATEELERLRLVERERRKETRSKGLEELQSLLGGKKKEDVVQSTKEISKKTLTFDDITNILGDMGE